MIVAASNFDARRALRSSSATPNRGDVAYFIDAARAKRSTSSPYANYWLLLMLLSLFWTHTLSCTTTKLRCTGLDTAGSFDGDTFVPDSGCFFGIPSADDTRAIVTGSWLFVAGGSNLWATVMSLGNQLAPGAFAWRDDFDNVPRYVDLIW